MAQAETRAANHQSRTEAQVAEHASSRTARIEAARTRNTADLAELRAKPKLDGRDRLKLARLLRDEEELADVSPSNGTLAINRCLQLWRAVHNWGILRKKTNATPFKVRHEDGSLSAVKLFPERKRTRRLRPGERERLLAACQPHLRALVEAALETCGRKGDLLKLQWSEVDFARNQIRDDKTKDAEHRWIPMTTRLRAILDMRKLDPDGEEWKPTDFVFGNTAGVEVKSIKTARKATCRRAGIRGLRFHDLRREGASSLLEGGVPQHYVQKILGHANIKTTSTYLAGTDEGLHEVMKTFERQRSRTRRPRSSAKRKETTIPATVCQ